MTLWGDKQNAQARQLNSSYKISHIQKHMSFNVHKNTSICLSYSAICNVSFGRSTRCRRGLRWEAARCASKVSPKLGLAIKGTELMFSDEIQLRNMVRETKFQNSKLSTLTFNACDTRFPKAGTANDNKGKIHLDLENKISTYAPRWFEMCAIWFFDVLLNARLTCCSRHVVRMRGHACGAMSWESVTTSFDAHEVAPFLDERDATGPILTVPIWNTRWKSNDPDWRKSYRRGMR